MNQQKFCTIAYTYSAYIQRLLHKTSSFARRNQERILLRLVFGRLNAHSYRRCWKGDRCEPIHFCAHVIKNPSSILPCKRAGFKWNTLYYVQDIAYKSIKCIYKHKRDDNANFEVKSDKFNVYRICILVTVSS
jgi:hypothetical protein